MTLAKVQQVIAIILLVSMMLNAGLGADRSELLAVLKNASLLLRALLANFVVLPLAAIVVTTILHISDPIATGILLMAIAPGVPFVILAGGAKKGGSHELAVTLALVLPLLSFVTIPVMAQWLLPLAERVSVPPAQLYGLLLYQLAPLLAGIAIAARTPSLARTLNAALARVTPVALLALFAMLIPNIIRSVGSIFGSLGILAMIVVCALALGTGWFLGGPKRDERFTLAVATNLRNPAIAMVIATQRFPDPAVAATVAVYFLIQFLAATLFARKQPGTIG